MIESYGKAPGCQDKAGTPTISRRIHTLLLVGTVRCAVRAASNGATGVKTVRLAWEFVPPALRGPGHRSAMSLPFLRTMRGYAHQFLAGFVQI